MKRYIDADAFEKQIKETYCKDCDNPNGMRCLLCPTHDMLQKIYYAPTADVAEVKHGEWDVNVGMNFNKERICPICKKRIESNYWEFCPHCGAKMDGGK